MSSSNPKPTTPSAAEMDAIVSGKKPVPNSIKNSAEYQNEGGRAVSNSDYAKSAAAHKKALAEKAAKKKLADKLTKSGVKRAMHEVKKSGSKKYVGTPTSPVH